jgi:hypothetical protein
MGISQGFIFQVMSKVAEGQGVFIGANAWARGTF